MKNLVGAALVLGLVACGGAEVVPIGSGGAGGGSSSTETGATAVGPTVGSTSSGASTTSSQGPGAGGNGGEGGAGQGGEGAGGEGGAGGASCERGCGDEELCGGSRRGLDDDCDGDVDEGCDCLPGETAGCFEGDASALAASPATCAKGTMTCGPDGQWGACEGGVFSTDACVDTEDDECRPLRALPYLPLDLAGGLGTFGDDADSETFAVTCPEGVACFPVTGSSFRPLQGGHYEVRYSKTVDGEPSSCSFPLIVGSPGLRVELAWNYAAGTDLDVHLFQPGTNPLLDAGGQANDCTWDNCTVNDYASDEGVEWFPPNGVPPEPTAWFLDPILTRNGCYFIPRGRGAEWQALGRGCHNPRMDLDNITCSLAQTNPEQQDACVAENINIDFPPVSSWMRMGVVAYSGAANQPILRVSCDGEVRAVLGPNGFAAPLTLTPGQNLMQTGWLAADVAFSDDGCARTCEVVPIHPAGQPTAALVGPVPLAGPALPSPL